MSIAEIRAMSRTEQLQTMELLWDVLCHDREEPESPAWHQAVLAERKAGMESSRSKFMSIDEVKRRASA
jgi:hypothetical protein